MVGRIILINFSRNHSGYPIESRAVETEYFVVKFYLITRLNPKACNLFIYCLNVIKQSQTICLVFVFAQDHTHGLPLHLFIRMSNDIGPDQDVCSFVLFSFFMSMITLNQPKRQGIHSRTPLSPKPFTVWHRAFRRLRRRRC